MAAKTDFAILRNLAFYNGHQTGYFYFNSLLLDDNKYKHPNEEYIAKAKEIGNIGKGVLSTYPSFAKDDDTLAVEKLNKLIEFMRKAVEYEKINEINFFKDKIYKLRQVKRFKNDKAAKELEQYLNPDNFEYNKVISLINALLQGTKTTKDIVQYEEKHINNIHEALNGDGKKKKGLINAHESQLEGLWKSQTRIGAAIRNKYENKGGREEFLLTRRKALERKILFDYATHGNLYSDYGKKKGNRKFIPGAKRWLSKVEGSIEQEIAHWVTEQINEKFHDPAIYNLVKKNIENNYKKNKADIDSSEMEKEIKAVLVKTIMAYAYKHIPEILNKAYSTLDVNELIKIAEDIKYVNIKGLNNNLGEAGKSIKLFDDAINQVKLSTNLAEGLYEAYKPLIQEIDEQMLSKEQLILKSIMKNNSLDEKYEQIYFLINKLEKLNEELQEQKNKQQEITDQLLELNKFEAKGKNEEEKTITIRLKLENGEIDFKDLKAQLEKTKVFSSVGKKSFGTANDLKQIITQLKTATSFSIKQDLINMIRPAIQTLGFSSVKEGERQVIEMMKTAIENKRFLIKAPTLQEISQGIQESINGSKDYKQWMSTINEKNDFIVIATIENDGKIPGLKKAIRQSINASSKVLAKQIESAVNKASDNILTIFSDNFYSGIKTGKKYHIINNIKVKSDAFFKAIYKQEKQYNTLDKTSEELNKIWAKYEKVSKKAGATQQELDKQKEEFLLALKNSFFQSSTMKTYGQYINDIGFHGGSLGSNAFKQIDNMAQIFKAAGLELPKKDKTWLYNAVINCSPLSIVGETHKHIIEDYLGAMAAFALFDEGGAEIEIINNVTKRAQKASSTVKILHLYLVNGIYVPGSYVLQQVLEELEACINNACKAYESSRKGAGITIINRVNSSIIPNRGKEEPEDYNPWGTVANKAKKMVELKIFFLAGLLDVMHQINKTLGEIPVLE